jgi:hypothetical protein
MFRKAHHLQRIAIVGLAWAALTASSTGASTGDKVADLLDAGKPIEAFALAQQKSGEGDPEGDFALGWFYDLGDHITADKAKALGYYRKCAHAGLSQCQWRLGVMFDTGDGVAADPAAAFGWISKAAAQGNAGAQSSLAVLYATGHGTAVDYAKALELYKTAAKNGQAQGFYGAGVMYLDGQGVPKDGETAAAWFSVGAAVGDPQAKAVTDMLLKDQKTDVLDRVAAKATAIYSEYVGPVRLAPPPPVAADAPKTP